MEWEDWTATQELRVLALTWLEYVYECVISPERTFVFDGVVWIGLRSWHHDWSQDVGHLSLF